MKFRKKPVVIEAFQLQDPDIHTDAADELHEWADAYGFTNWESSTDGVVIQTLEGAMLASPGDWIIKGVKGEFYPCKPDIFEATYERAEDPSHG
jgi:hypothetical protein